MAAHAQKPAAAPQQAEELLAEARTSFSQKQYVRALEAGHRLRKMASGMHDGQLEWESHMILAETSIRLNDPFASLEYGLKSREIARSLDKRYTSQSYLLLIDLFENLGLSEKQAEYIRLAREELHPEGVMAWPLLERQARSFEQMNRLEEAAQAWEELLTSATRLHHDSLVRSCHMQLSRIRTASGRFTEALGHEERLLATSATPIQKAISRNNMGLLWLYLEKPMEAEQKFLEALSADGLSPEMQDQYRFNLALAAFRNQHHTAALQHLDRIKRSAESRNDSRSICLSWYLKSRIFLDLDDQTQAANYAAEAIPLAEELNLYDIALNLHELLAGIAESSGENGRANEHRAIAQSIRNRAEQERKEESVRYGDLLMSVQSKENQVLQNIANELGQKIILQKELEESRRQREVSDLLHQKEIREADLLREQMSHEQAQKELALLQSALQTEQQEKTILGLERQRTAQLLELSRVNHEKEAAARHLRLLQQENLILEGARKIEQERSGRITATRNLGLTAASLLLALLTFVSRSFMITRSKNKVIAEQSRSIRHMNDELRERNEDIISGIRNAQNFQGSIIPREEDIRRHFPDSFLIHQPLDIVSGDIPFLLRTGQTVYLGAIDCIGHGVSAAMLSFMAYYNLKELTETGGEDPCGEVLGQLHRSLLRSLSRDSGPHDFASGIDISLCRIDLASGLMQFAGANLPVIIVSGGQAERLRGDVFSVGDALTDQRAEFSTHERRIAAGDRIFLLSDGLVHQFGGDTGQRKYSMKRLLGQLTGTCHLPMEEVRSIIHTAFLEWKGAHEQTDDLMLMGISLPENTRPGC